MKLENQVCTLEQAVSLRMFGVARPERADGLYFNTLPKKEQGEIKMLESRFVDLRQTSAFNASELAKMLPVELDGFFDGVKIGNDMDSEAGVFYTASYESVPANRAGVKSIFVESGQLAHCLAKMLLHLLASNLTTSEEVNARLTAD